MLNLYGACASIFQNQMVINANSELISVNTENGNLLWSKKNVAVSAALVYYNDNIYYIGGDKLQQYRASSGDFIGAYNSPNASISDARFINYYSITLDENQGLLYIQDSKYINCYRLK